MNNKNSLEGKLHLFSETGTEGGDWVFQDLDYIFLNTTIYSCKKCGLYRVKEPTSHTLPLFKKPKYSYAPPLFKKSKYCSAEDHQFELSPKEHYDPRGRHLLENGDKLTIYHPENKEEVWSGVIDLKFCDSSSNQAFGWWIHTNQKGIDKDLWAEYFLNNYPAELISLKK